MMKFFFLTLLAMAASMSGAQDSSVDVMFADGPTQEIVAEPVFIPPVADTVSREMIVFSKDPFFQTDFGKRVFNWMQQYITAYFSTLDMEVQFPNTGMRFLRDVVHGRSRDLNCQTWGTYCDAYGIYNGYNFCAFCNAFNCYSQGFDCVKDRRYLQVVQHRAEHGDDPRKLRELTGLTSMACSVSHAEMVDGILQQIPASVAGSHVSILPYFNSLQCELIEKVG